MNKRVLASVAAAAVVAIIVLWPGDDEQPGSKSQPADKQGQQHAPRTAGPDHDRYQGAPWYPQPRGMPPPLHGNRRADGFRFRTDESDPSVSNPYAYPQRPRYRFRPEQQPTSQRQRFSGNFAPRSTPRTEGYGYDAAPSADWDTGYDGRSNPNPSPPGYGGYPGPSPSTPDYAASSRLGSPPQTSLSPTYPGEMQTYGMSPAQPWDTPSLSPGSTQPWEERSYSPNPGQPGSNPIYDPASPQPWQNPAYTPYQTSPQPWEAPDRGNPPPYSGSPNQALYSVR